MSTCLCDLGHPPWCADCQARLEDQLAVAIAIAKGEHRRYVIGHCTDAKGLDAWCVVDALEDRNSSDWKIRDQHELLSVTLSLRIGILMTQVEPVDTSSEHVEEPTQNEHEATP